MLGNPVCTHPVNQLPTFLGQTGANLQGSISLLSRLPLSATAEAAFPSRSPPSRPRCPGPSKTLSSPQSSEELAPVCLQVLANRRNVRIIITPPRSAQPNPTLAHLEGCGHTKKSETSSCGCLARAQGRLNPLLFSYEAASTMEWLLSDHRPSNAKDKLL